MLNKLDQVVAQMGPNKPQPAVVQEVYRNIISK